MTFNYYWKAFFLNGLNSNFNSLKFEILIKSCINTGTNVVLKIYFMVLWPLNFTEISIFGKNLAFLFKVVPFTKQQVEECVEDFLVQFSVFVKLNVFIDEVLRITDPAFWIWDWITLNREVQYRSRYNFFFFLRSVYSFQLIFLFIY